MFILVPFICRGVLVRFSGLEPDSHSDQGRIRSGARVLGWKPIRDGYASARRCSRL